MKSIAGSCTSCEGYDVGLAVAIVEISINSKDPSEFSSVSYFSAFVMASNEDMSSLSGEPEAMVELCRWFEKANVASTWL